MGGSRRVGQSEYQADMSQLRPRPYNTADLPNVLISWLNDHQTRDAGTVGEEPEASISLVRPANNHHKSE